jgi:hypothetical protein
LFGLLFVKGMFNSLLEGSGAANAISIQGNRIFVDSSDITFFHWRQMPLNLIND